ncbi:unnamed protein product [Durusdinium trenchii]|uniref:Uncharacterized protein n=1 Tax=Durusdinium trenchii TaxID=1381693 RepID=A0ABP0MKJ0_9DINO
MMHMSIAQSLQVHEESTRTSTRLIIGVHTASSAEVHAGREMAMRAIGQRNAGTCNKIFGAQRQIRWCSRLRGSKMVAEEMGIACWSWWCGGARIVAPLRKGVWAHSETAVFCHFSLGFGMKGKITLRPLEAHQNRMWKNVVGAKWQL